jgi:hypothetical protein
VWLADGEVLVTGGITMSGGGPTNSAETFDPLTGHWTTLSSTMLAARSGHSVTQLLDGSVLIAGGRGSGGAPVNTLEILQLGSRQFTAAGTLQTARFGHAADVLEDGRVFIAGGSSLDGDGNPVTLASTEIFDPAKGATAGPTLNPPRTGASVTTLLDGTVLIAGGSYPEGAAQGAPAELDNIDVFNPADGSLTPAPAKLTQARSGHQAFLLPHNANVLFVGGTFNGSAVASAEQYTPWTGTMKPTTMAAARTNATGSPLNVLNFYRPNDGLILIAGGKDASGTPQASGELYRFATVTTDKIDYSPGQTVNITGSGWQPNETITLSFRERPSIDTPGPFTATTDANGNFTDTEFAPDPNDLGVRFFLTAVGSASGLQAQHTFTDKIQTSQTLVCDPNPVQVNQTSTCTMTVWPKDNQANVAGTVTWTADSAKGTFSPTSCTLAPIAPNSKTLSCSVVYTPISSQTITVTYTPNANGQIDVVVLQEIVSITPTTLTLDAPNPSTVASGSAGPVTFTAHLSYSGTPIVGRAIDFKVDGNAAGTQNTDSAGTATLSTYNPSALPVGPHNVVASFGGDTTYTGATSDPRTLTVSQLSSLTITADNQTVTYGGTMPTLSWTANPNVTLDTNPNCTSSTTATDKVGTYTGVITCSGAVKAGYTIGYAAGSLTVTQAATTTTLANTNGTAPSSVYGHEVDLSATVTRQDNGNPVTVGTVTFSTSDNVASATVALNGSGVANLAISTLPVIASPGRTVTATYNPPINNPPTTPASNFGGSSDHFTHFVTPATLTASVTASDKVYNGTADATINNCSLATVLFTDVVTCTAAGPNTFSDANVGTGKTVTATNISLGGANAGNYTLSSTSATTTASITPAPVTATAGSYSGAYDGSSHAPAPACAVTGTYTGDLACTNTPASVGPDVSSGTVTPNVTGTGLTNFTITPVNGTFSITQTTSTVTVSCPASVTYNGVAQTPCTASVTGAGGLSQSLTVNYTNNTNKGTATASATFAGDTNHTGNSDSKTFIIDPAPLTVTAGSYSGVYDGSSHALSACTVSANFDSLSCTNSPAGPVGPGVGSGTITAVISGSTSNYTVTNNPGSWSITPRPVTITAGSYSGVYDGQAHSPSGCTSNYAGVTCSNSPSSVGPGIGGAAVTPTPDYVTGNAADYTLTPVNGAWSITAAPLTVTAGSYSGLYDGSSHALTACTVSTNFDSLSCTNSPAGPVGPHVGSGTITAVISGSTSNYSVTNNSGSWSITARPVTITAGSYSGVYDGQPHSPSACTSNYAGLTCSNNPSSVGPGIGGAAVTPTPNYRDGNATDYTLTPVNGAWSITAAPLTVTAGSYSGVYDGSSHPLSACTVSTNYDSLSCTNDPVGPVGPHVGSGTVTAVISGSTSNYTVTNNSGSWSITPAAVTATAGSYNGTYDGNTHALSACAITGDYHGGLTCTNSPLGPVGPDVTTVPVTVTPQITGNTTDYTITSVNGSYSIAKAPVTATAGSYTGTYNGVAHSPSACTVTGAYTGSLTCSNNPATVGPGWGSGIITPSVNGPNQGNFTITLADGSWSIAKATVTATGGSYSGAYDGSSHPLSACTVSSNYDSLTCTNSPTGPVGPDVGSGTVTAQIVGDTSNYTVTKNPGAWSITPARVFATVNITTDKGNVSGLPNVQYSDLVGINVSIPIIGVNPLNACHLTGVTADACVQVNIGAQTFTIPLNVSGPNLTGSVNNQQLFDAPGSQPVVFIVGNGSNNLSEVNANYSVMPLYKANGTVFPAALPVVKVTQEDAAVGYNGTTYFAVPATQTVLNIPVAYTLQDATAAATATFHDNFAGDITKTGKVNISISGTYLDPTTNAEKNYPTTSCTNVSISPVPGQVDPTNSLPSTATTGSCTFNSVPVNGTYLLTISPATGSYYTFSDETDTTVQIVTSNGGGGFITGGGYQKASYLTTDPVLSQIGVKPAGVLANVTSKMNFGYVAKYNKSGKNLQASVNIIVRAACSSVQANLQTLGLSYTPATSGTCLYQIKSNKVISMTDNAYVSSCTTATKVCSPGYGVLVVGANVQDITGDTPISMQGNLTLQLVMYDNGEPGSGVLADPLTVDVRDNSGNLWFSNSWTGTKTLILDGSATGTNNTIFAPLIQGGNIQVH